MHDGIIDVEACGIDMAAVKISRHGFSRNMLYKGGLELCRNVGTGRLISTLSELLRICSRICQPIINLAAHSSSSQLGHKMILNPLF